MENNNNSKIFYTSVANYVTLNDIPDLINHLSYMKEVYDQGIFCNKDIVAEFGPCSVALKDESLPIMTIKEITTIPLFNEEQSNIMEKIYGECIDYNDETDEEYLNYHVFRVDDDDVKNHLENVIINYENCFCKTLTVEVTHFSRDENNNILREYSSGQITLFKDYSGKVHHATNLDLEKLLFGEKQSDSLTA